MQACYSVKSYKNYIVENTYLCKITHIWYDGYDAVFTDNYPLTAIEVCPPGNYVALYFNFNNRDYIKYLTYDERYEEPFEAKLSHPLYDIDILE